MEESDGVSSTQRTTGSDTVEDTEERAIRTIPIVTTLSFVHVVQDKTRGVRVTLTCYNCREFFSCEKPKESPIHLSKEHTTMCETVSRSYENDWRRIMTNTLNLLLDEVNRREF